MIKGRFTKSWLFCATQDVPVSTNALALVLLCALFGHGGGFDFKQQIRAADVADDRQPRPGKVALAGVEYLLDLGRFAVGYHL